MRWPCVFFLAVFFLFVHSHLFLFLSLLSDDLSLYLTISENLFSLPGVWVSLAKAITLIPSFLRFAGIWSLLYNSNETPASFALKSVCFCNFAITVSRALCPTP